MKNLRPICSAALAVLGLAAVYALTVGALAVFGVL